MAMKMAAPSPPWPAAWDGMGWAAATDGMGWAAAWDGMGWAAAWDGMGWPAAWDGMGWPASTCHSEPSGEESKPRFLENALAPAMGLPAGCCGGKIPRSAPLGIAGNERENERTIRKRRNNLSRPKAIVSNRLQDQGWYTQEHEQSV